MTYTPNNQGEKRILEQTLDNMTQRKEAPRGVYLMLLLLFILTFLLVTRSSGKTGLIDVWGMQIPASSFTGTYSSISNICIILLVVFCGKKGFYTSLLGLLIQFPGIFIGLILNHNYNTIPGIFGNVLTIVAIIIIHVTNQRIDRFQKRLRDQAVTDTLTHLPNRFACSELVNNMIRKGEAFAIVSIDINGFKSINDTMGFNAGNDVLVKIASRWKEIADTGSSGTLDFITRFGGDEFALVIRCFSSDDEILRTIAQYESVLEKRMTVEGCDFYITASFGYAQFPDDAANMDSLLSAADAAMHEVKRMRNSNHILRFSQDLVKEEHTLEIERKIRSALENDRLLFYLQPQYDMDHNLRGFEALARMKDEKGNMISPGEFIPVSEKVGLVDKIDATVFKKSVAFFSELLEKTGADLILSVNISVRHLMKNGFFDELKALMSDTSVPPGNLEIEITESIMIDSTEKALRCIDQIKSLGIQIAIDDFGTGYSSLSYLNNFPANLLKIDKSFIDKMNESDSSKQYVASIISIGHILGFDVISEGVEKPEQLETLKENGCDFIQGYIWGRPMPPEDILRLVEEEVANG